MRLRPVDCVERGAVHFFISLSGKSETAQRVLTELCTKLAGHKVFVYHLIGLGDKWRWELYHQLAICNAAVVLLDKTTLAQRWVQREVDVLLWRQAFNPDLVIVPILLDDTAPGLVRTNGYGEFTETQFLEAGREGLNPAEIAERVVERFAQVKAAPETRMEEWFEDIEAVLRRIGDRERLMKAARALGLSEEDAAQLRLPGGCRYFAHRFLCHSLGDATIDAVNSLLFRTDAETLRQFITLIKPTWVDEAAARPLVAHGRKSQFVVVLNAAESRTAIEYVRRATCMDLRVRTETVLAAAGQRSTRAGQRSTKAVQRSAKADQLDVDGLVAQCERAVLRLLGGDSALGQSFSDIRPEDISDGPPHGGYLIIDVTKVSKKAAAQAVSTIRKRFWWLVVILVVGRSAPSQETIASWRLDEARVLSPVLGDYDENTAWRAIGDLGRMIKLASGEDLT